jgi:hypothetical protein
MQKEQTLRAVTIRQLVRVRALAARARGPGAGALCRGARRWRSARPQPPAAAAPLNAPHRPRLTPWPTRTWSSTAPTFPT